MNFNNRINRLSSTLTLLSKGQELSTPSLVELKEFKANPKISIKIVKKKFDCLNIIFS